MSKPRLLILSASTGNGHMSAAYAVAAEAEIAGMAAEVIDVLDFTSAGFTSWYRGGYEKLVKDKPAVWGHLYKSSDRPLFNYTFQTGLDYVFTKRVRKAIQEFKPDWVICTHSLPQPRLVPLRREFGFRIGIVVTDLYVHRMWLRGRPDYFFVPQQWSREVLMRRRPSLGKHSLVTGIPIHPVFGEIKFEREWGGEKVALVSSGGIGGGPLVGAVQQVLDAGWRVKVIAGRNEAVKEDLTMAFGDNQMVEIFGHIDQNKMAELMQTCHLLVSKPGGLTTFESLASGIPFMVYWPFLIPGQEEGNALFLKDCGAGVIVTEVQQIESELEYLDVEKLKKMSESGLAQALPHAARDIVEALQRL
ncbi:MAG: MGDG synthase family glycosyltransferase [Fimbriimonadaceae bacterium]